MKRKRLPCRGLAGVLLPLLLQSSCDSEEVVVDGFVEGHFVVEGSITDASGEAVPGAQIVLRVREDHCDNPDVTSPRTVESDSSGDFLRTVILPLFIPQVCLVYRVTPPQGTGLETVEREIPEITVVPVSAPPDTVEIHVTLESM